MPTCRQHHARLKSTFTSGACSPLPFAFQILYSLSLCKPVRRRLELVVLCWQDRLNHTITAQAAPLRSACSAGTFSKWPSGSDAPAQKSRFLRSATLQCVAQLNTLDHTTLHCRQVHEDDTSTTCCRFLKIALSVGHRSKGFRKHQGSSWAQVLTESFSRSAARSDMAKTVRNNVSSNSLKLFLARKGV